MIRGKPKQSFRSLHTNSRCFVLMCLLNTVASGLPGARSGVESDSCPDLGLLTRLRRECGWKSIGVCESVTHHRNCKNLDVFSSWSGELCVMNQQCFPNHSSLRSPSRPDCKRTLETPCASSVFSRDATSGWPIRGRRSRQSKLVVLLKAMASSRA